jgi:hypothetical protein
MGSSTGSPAARVPRPRARAAASGSPEAPAPQATSTYKLQELEKQGLVVDEELLKLPKGYHWCVPPAARPRCPSAEVPPDLTRPPPRRRYETMMVLRPTLSEEER